MTSSTGATAIPASSSGSASREWTTVGRRCCLRRRSPSDARAPGTAEVTGRATPASERAGDIRIGISSWGGLPGFYPSSVKSAEKLAWFARFFTVVEVNVSFYRIVPPHTYVNWAEMTPPDFVFDVKAFGELTHFRDPPPDETFTSFR